MQNDFAIIDVNLPKHISETHDFQQHRTTDSVEYRTREATQLLTYLFDNYIELNEPTHVFLMGTNTGHGAIINFIKANDERAQEQVTAAISFVDDVPLQSCKSATNDNLASWYHAISLAFGVLDHNYFYTDFAQKPRKRFGKVHRSPAENLTDMLIEHKDRVFELLLEDTEDWRSNRSHSDQGKSMDVPERLTSPKRALPPIGNFALSPGPKAATKLVQSPRMRAADGPASPRKTQTQSPRRLSPVRSRAMTPDERLSRGPAG